MVQAPNVKLKKPEITETWEKLIRECVSGNIITQCQDRILQKNVYLSKIIGFRTKETYE